MDSEIRDSFGQALPRLRLRVGVVVWGILALVGQASVASGQAVLDQYYAPSVAGTTGGASVLGQTFTVGVTGTLTQASLGLAQMPPAVLQVEIRQLVGDSPSPSSDDILASRTAIGLGNTWMDVDVSAANIAVNAGDRLAITVYSCCFNFVNLRSAFDANATYEGGEAFISGSPNTSFFTFGRPVDIHFRTYVEPIPEPSGIEILGVVFLCGLVFVGFQRNRHGQHRNAIRRYFATRGAEMTACP